VVADRSQMQLTIITYSSATQVRKIESVNRTSQVKVGLSSAKIPQLLPLPTDGVGADPLNT
jgi:hypothetical protein